MEAPEILKYSEELLKAAFHKTHDMEQARELTQEACLCVLTALHMGKNIDNPKAYLFSVLQHLFCRSLRQKYQMSVVCYGEMPADIAEETDCFAHLEKAEESEAVRRELAFLAGSFREVMVRYYMQEQSVAQIAEEMGLPKGTVLSRLDMGRKKVKKGVEHMEKYQQNSYQPDRLALGINGSTGLGKEPFSCVQTLLNQNILILAYEKPVTPLELAQALGTSMAFVEESVETLLYEQLLKKEGKKVFTDFVIISPAEDEKNLQTSIQYAGETFAQANELFLEMTKEYKKIEGFRHCSDTWRYMLGVLSCRIHYMSDLDEAVTGRAEDYTQYPDRPNFGKWVAVGTRFPAGYINQERARYSVSGRSGTGDISSSIKGSVEWDTALGHTHGIPFQYSVDQKERALAIEAIAAGNPSARQALLIPQLEEYGFIHAEEGKKVSAVPFITEEEEKQFFAIEREFAHRYNRLFLDKMVSTAKVHSVKYPRRISIIPSFMFAEPLFYHSMEYIYLAAKAGAITLAPEQKYPIMYIIKR